MMIAGRRWRRPIIACVDRGLGSVHRGNHSTFEMLRKR
jgi:hypothetical protein